MRIAVVPYQPKQALTILRLFRPRPPAIDFGPEVISILEPSTN
jgi:hypothetical protein